MILLSSVLMIFFFLFLACCFTVYDAVYMFFKPCFQVLAVVYAIMMTRDEDLTWQMRAIRVLPMFVLPAVSSLIYSTVVNFTRMRKCPKALSDNTVSNSCGTSLCTSACVQNFQRCYFSFCFAFCEICVLCMNT
jgi:hypothetical protein